MAGAEAGAVVAMKIFVEKDEVAPVRIALKALGAASYGPATARIAKKNMHEPPDSAPESVGHSTLKSSP